MRTPVAMVALTNKEIDYGVATRSLLVSTVKGLPLKIAMYWLRAPLHVLNAKPEIRSIQELGGKTISIAGVTETRVQEGDDKFDVSALEAFDDQRS